MLTSDTSNRPTGDRLRPPRRRTTCLQMRRRSKHASRPPRRCNHGGVGPPNDHGCSVRTPGRRRWSKFGSDKLSSTWCDHCRPCASRDGFLGWQRSAARARSTSRAAVPRPVKPRAGLPRAAILRYSYHLWCEKSSQPGKPGIITCSPRPDFCGVDLEE